MHPAIPPSAPPTGGRAAVGAGLLLGVVLASPAPAQPWVLPASQSAATRELPGASVLPLGVASARVQQLYDASEVGTDRLVVQRVSLRYDGPSAGPQRRRAVQRFTLHVGATAVGLDRAGSDFGANLSAPLQAGLAGVRLDYTTDGLASAGPEPWGSPTGELSLPLSRPIAVTIPPQGALVVEFLVEGNDPTGGVADLDFFVDPANADNPGLSVHQGRGCPTAQAAPEILLETAGLFEPGGSLTIQGRHWLPQAPVVVFLTALLRNAPLAVPGTSSPICWFYVDEQTGPSLLLVTDAAGNIPPFGRTNTLPIPKRPDIPGAVLYVQGVSVASQGTSNILGIASSNYRAIVLGQAKTPAAGAWLAAHHLDATAPVASVALWGGLALRLE